MPVIPHRKNLFQDRKELYQLLLACKQASIEKDQTQIISISVEIEAVDPLAVLQAIAKPNHLHFYFEKHGQGEAIAAIDAVVSQKLDGTQRFELAQEFIQSCLPNITITGDTDLPFSGPHFFCSFTFFDQSAQDAAPFPAATIFLPRWQISRHQERCTLVTNLAINFNHNLERILDSLWHDFEAIHAIQYTPVHLDIHHPIVLNQQEAAYGQFKASVLSTLASIHQQHFYKTVLAHAIDIFSLTPFHIADSLHNLRQLYPDCYVFSTGNGKGVNFIGASPERLISIYNRELVTDALAGSAPRGKTAIEDAQLASSLLGSEKERREHQVVADFITQRLSHLGLTPHLARSPGLLKLPNIQHLHTPIRAQVPPTVHPLEIVAELHPTPAVAGMPREIACQQIRHYETFERSLYAAPLGWLDHKANGEFVVGIRSALINGCHARLYAGAGVVAGSDPDKELAEIQLKLQALLKALV